MPSLQHEFLLMLFRSRPTLYEACIDEALRAKIPPYRSMRIDSANLTEIQPTEYRADLVITLMQDEPVMSMIIEAQLQRDERKPFVWPLYVASLRARLECPVGLLVVTLDEGVAKWAAKSVYLGGRNDFHAEVAGPATIPIITEEDQARANPQLAALSVMAHGGRVHRETAVKIGRIAMQACKLVKAESRKIYAETILKSLSGPARQEVKAMSWADLDLSWEEVDYGSEFERKHFARGEAHGRTEILLKQLALRFGALSPDVQARVKALSTDELDVIAERLLSAETLQQALACSNAGLSQ